uniref:Uncharacterized protein n=1 Tax=Callorhinchus milii TaxID=7868 RepID=A0A4W3HEV2_CALMI
MAFAAEASSLTDVHHFCRERCGREPCCDGFTLSIIALHRGTILCGLISHPDVLLCNKGDWQMPTLGGQGTCRGVRSNKETKTFTFNIGGLEFSGCKSVSKHRTLLAT